MIFTIAFICTTGVVTSLSYDDALTFSSSFTTLCSWPPWVLVTSLDEYGNDVFPGYIGFANRASSVLGVQPAEETRPFVVKSLGGGNQYGVYVLWSIIEEHQSYLIHH